jgi:hypothetical protein
MAAVVLDNVNKRGTKMGTILISENVSLDGVIQDPAGDKGFRVGGWVGLIKDSPPQTWRGPARSSRAKPWSRRPQTTGSGSSGPRMPG